jgi:hypothetical protein
LGINYPETDEEDLNTEEVEIGDKEEMTVHLEGEGAIQEDFVIMDWDFLYFKNFINQ